MSTPVSGAAEFFTQAAAAVIIDSNRPLGPDAMVRWHDKVGGPRDNSGRRIWTPQVCEQIRAARAGMGRQAQ